MIFLASLCFTACSSDDDGGDTQLPETWEVTAILTPTGLGDFGYNDQMYLGFCYVREELGCDVIVRSPSSVSEANDMTEEWMNAESVRGKYRLLVLCDESYSELVRQKEWQNTSYNAILQLDSDDNTLSAYTRAMPLYGACYAVGRMMNQVSGSDAKHAAVVMANSEDKGIKDGREGFIKGATEAGVTIDTYYLSDKASEGYNLSDSIYHLCYAIAPKTFFMLPLAGGSNNGIYRYGREKHDDNIVTCALDNDMAYTSYCSVFGIMKHIDQVILDFCRNWKNDVFNAEHVTCGIGSGYVEVQISSLYTDRFIDSLKAIMPEAIELENNKYNISNN